MPSPEETADQVAKARLALEAAEAEHAAALTTADDNRTPEELMLALLDEIVMRLGNRPSFRALLDRLKAKVSRPAPAPTLESETKVETIRGIHHN
jgi:hypothetical protein